VRRARSATNRAATSAFFFITSTPSGWRIVAGNLSYVGTIYLSKGSVKWRRGGVRGEFFWPGSPGGAVVIVLALNKQHDNQPSTSE
jgi:hypothetical protein